MKNYSFFSVFIVLIILVSFSNCTKKNDAHDKILSASSLIDLSFTPSEIDSMKDGLDYAKKAYDEIRTENIDNNVSPALIFDPRPMNFKIPILQKKQNWDIPKGIELPENMNQLAFYSIPELASLIKYKKISSFDLTRYFIDRLKKFNDTLECLVSLTEVRALEQAKKVDQELAKGIYRGILHGIPFGVKDLFAVENYKTTWGAMPFKDQSINYTASVVRNLEQAGAVLVAKLSLGALAMGDVWFDGITKNPWDLSQGSSGSSAGSAAATAAGLVPFAIGTETWGSIVSPSTRCGVTGLRPSFGRISRDGAMALSWSMDKVGPICKSAYDCAIVFSAIHGKHPGDPSSVEYPFNYEEKGLNKMKIAYFENLFNEEYRGKENDLNVLELLKEMGIDLIPVELKSEFPVSSLSIILEAEAAAAFDEITRNNKDDELVAQHKNAWPNIFRTARFIPAAEYIQANRIRTKLIEEFTSLIKNYDAILTPSFGGNQLLLTNLTGNPCLVMPNGFDDKNRPTSISILGNLYDEASILFLAKVIQDNTDFDDTHPPYFLGSDAD